MSNPIPTGFFAYPSTPPVIAESIHSAIERINESSLIFIKPWDQCRVGGKIIIEELCREIANANVFCADLTGLNANVLFELGFAIAKDRRIWLTMDKSRSQTKKDFEQLKILTTVGCADCCNSIEMQTAFQKDAPYADTDSTVFKSVIEAHLTLGSKPSLVYLESRHHNEASVRLRNALDKQPLPVVVDDPRESAVQPLTWYGSQVFSSLGVVCHLTDPTREGAQLDNARHVLVAGMAYGMGKPLLMITEGDFLAPVDYRDILRQYIIPSQAKKYLDDWIKPITATSVEDEAVRKDYVASVRLAGDLKGLRIGEYEAEREADELIDRYFVETKSYHEALGGRHVIFVGRKGSGKTANLLKIAVELESDRRNVVCIIKPVAYELEGVLELMKRYRQRDAKGYMLESLWKFLLYSELARKVAELVLRRSSGQVEECEERLMSLMDQHGGMLREDFSVRLERCANQVLACPTDTPSTESVRLAISEALHDTILKDLRIALGQALTKKSRVTILVDNLDKAWDKTSDIPLLSEFLLGLLGAASRLNVELRHKDTWREPVNANLVVFLRSDIFERVLDVAREPDKISFSRITWSDRELLLRVIEERFVAASDVTKTPPELWRKYFCTHVRGLPPREYIVSRILPRPRDILFFVNAAIATAVNRQHGIVEDVDILTAETQYSQYALETILVENGLVVGRLEDVLYEFAGSSAIITRDDVNHCVARAKIPEDRIQQVVDRLCALTFMGVEVAENDFRFSEDACEYQRNVVLARKYAESKQNVPRYMINNAFRSFLEVIE